MEVVIIKSKFKQVVGLMFKKNISNIYVFPQEKERKFKIHTYFMRKPIDILVLDKNFYPTSLLRHYPPWQDINVWGKYLVEMPAGFSNRIDMSKRYTIKDLEELC